MTAAADRTPSISLKVEDDVARVRLAQGERGNPIDLAATVDMARVVTACSRNAQVRAVLIEADGRFFTVGGDLASLAAERDQVVPFILDATVGFHAAIARLTSLDAPVVVAVHGMCAGGGVSLAAAGDFVLAGQSAKFYAAYQGVGLAIDGGGSHTLPRKVGLARATSFYLRNEIWTSEQALGYGLVTEVHDDDVLPDAALALAKQLAAGPTKAFGEVKRLLRSTFDQPLEAQLEAEARAMVRAAETEDAWNALTAVANQQPATFRGR